VQLEERLLSAVDRDDELSPVRSLEGLASSSSSPRDVSSKMRSIGNMVYLMSLEVGGVSTSFIVDTGSSCTWVKEPKVDQMSGVRVLSHTSRILRYGLGEVWGYLVRGRVDLTSDFGFDLDFLSSTQQDMPDGVACDGLIGLAFEGLAGETDSSTFLRSFQQTQRFRDFSFSLVVADDLDLFSQSRITFGSNSELLEEEDASAQADSLVTLDVLMDYGEWSWTFWTVECDIFFNGGGHALSRQRLFLDSGTSFIGVPTTLKQRVLSEFLGDDLQRCGASDGNFLCPCYVTVNSISFAFAHGDQYLQVDLPSDEIFAFYEKDWCRLSVSFVDTDGWILGDTFLRKVVTVFDVDNRRVTLFPRSVSWYSKWSVAFRKHSGTALLLACLVVVSAYAFFCCCRKAAERHPRSQPLLA